MMATKAVVLLSGGLDSTTALYLAHSKGLELYAVSFVYGQRHDKELQCAQWQAEHLQVKKHYVIDLSFTAWDTSSLTHNAAGNNIEVGNLQRVEAPNTYVPARNMVFLSIAASVAESVGAQYIYIGVSEADYSGYVDCRESFIKAMQAAINQGTERKIINGTPIEIYAPFLHANKAEEVIMGVQLGVDFSHTWSCYKGGEHPCGQCDSCLLRARAFAEAGVPDPLT